MHKPLKSILYRRSVPLARSSYRYCSLGCNMYHALRRCGQYSIQTLILKLDVVALNTAMLTIRTQNISKSIVGLPPKT